jgi:hypothetical protein
MIDAAFKAAYDLPKLRRAIVPASPATVISPHEVTRHA